jgi:hypothetical protein
VLQSDSTSTLVKAYVGRSIYRQRRGYGVFFRLPALCQLPPDLDSAGFTDLCQSLRHFAPRKLGVEIIQKRNIYSCRMAGANRHPERWHVFLAMWPM